MSPDTAAELKTKLDRVVVTLTEEERRLAQAADTYEGSDQDLHAPLARGNLSQVRQQLEALGKVSDSLCQGQPADKIQPWAHFWAEPVNNGGSPVEYVYLPNTLTQPSPHPDLPRFLNGNDPLVKAAWNLPADSVVTCQMPNKMKTGRRFVERAFKITEID